MTQKESQVIAQFRNLAQQGYITASELDWCIGAVRNRTGLTRETRHQLRNTVHVIIERARTRMLKDAE